MIRLWMITFSQIVYREIIVFIKIIRSKFIDLIIMLTTNVLVFTYLMPYFGLKTGYGAFLIAGLIPVIGLFEVMPRTNQMIVDISGNKKISYILTLPLPTILSLAAIPIGWAACGSIFTILILPIGKLMLLKKFDLSNFSYLKFFLSFFSINILLAFFAYWITSLIKGMQYFAWIWSRIVNPIFMLGGYFYTWKAVYAASHAAGLLNLINPLIYSTEAVRSAIFGSAKYLPFWLSLSAIWVFILVFAFFSIKRIKKRLDCV